MNANLQTINNPDHPLATVIVDHFALDIDLIDDANQPIGRPWLSIAVDQYSRMITGFHLSLETPNNVSFAKCIANAIFPKDELLALHDIEADWNTSGLMKTVVIDNSHDLVSDNIKKACLQHDVRFERPSPNYPSMAGAAESVMRSITKELHNLPSLSLTFSGLEKWLITYICLDYHNQEHRNLGMSPKKKWDIGINENTELQLQALPSGAMELKELLLE